MNGDLATCTASSASRRPEAPAVLGPEGTIGHGEFHRRTEAAAGALMRHGLGRETPAVLRLADTSADLALLFGCFRLGVPVLTVATDEPDAQVGALAERAGARTTIAIGHSSAPGDLALEADALLAEPPPLPVPPGPDAPCLFQRSSGTTSGRPKLSLATHAAEHDRLVVTAFSGPDDRYLRVIRLGFMSGMRRAVSAVAVGGAVILVDGYRCAEDLAAAARLYGATWTMLLPVHLRDLLDAVPRGPLFPAMRITTSSARLTAAERRAVMNRLSPHLYAEYGSNEAWRFTTATPQEVRARPDTVGRALPGTELEVVDAAGRAVAPGMVGEVRARRWSIPLGYIDEGTRGATRFADGWFYPGDLGRLDAAGFLFLHGRTDDLLSVGGQKVFPIEIEDVLTADRRVREAAVIGVPSPRLGQVPLAAVVLNVPVPEEELVELCRMALGHDRAPRRVLAFAALPRSPGGKIDLRALRGLIDDRLRPDRAGDMAAPTPAGPSPL